MKLRELIVLYNYSQLSEKAKYNLFCKLVEIISDKIPQELEKEVSLEKLAGV